MSQPTNAAAIASWSTMPHQALAAFDPEGDVGRRTMLNPTIFRLLGDIHGARILDAGCGQGYLCLLLADRGASVVGVEPAQAPYDYAVAQQHRRRQAIHYLQADLAELPDLADPFDAVVANVVFQAIPQWVPAMRNCIHALRPGGLLLFSLEHPCFEDAAASWRQTGCVQVREYLREYERPGPYGVDFHRPLSTYLNTMTRLGCRLTELVEPGLDPELASEGTQAAVHVPNFVVVAARRA
jgi:SAM-dependent methyltransferase